MSSQTVVKFLPSPKENPYNKSSVLVQVHAGLAWCCELGREETCFEKPMNQQNPSLTHTKGPFAVQMGIVYCMPLGTLLLQPVPSPPGWEAALLPLPVTPTFLLCAKTHCTGKGQCLCHTRTGKLTTFLFPLQWAALGKSEPACRLPSALLFSHPLVVSSQVPEERREGLPHWAGAVQVRPKDFWPVGCSNWVSSPPCSRDNQLLPGRCPQGRGQLQLNWCISAPDSRLR